MKKLFTLSIFLVGLAFLVSGCIGLPWDWSNWSPFTWFPTGLLGLVLYFLPTIIAAIRKKTNLVAIFLVNLLTGWTIIGWIIALVWAVSK